MCHLSHEICQFGFSEQNSVGKEIVASLVVTCGLNQINIITTQKNVNSCYWLFSI